MTKRLLFSLYALALVAMGVATIVEKHEGTGFARQWIYGAWWFTALWALLLAVGIFYIIRRKMRKPSALALHGAFALILVGAFATHVSSKQGMVHLRQGEATHTYFVQTDGDDVEERQLPFSLTMEKFNIAYHAGTAAAADYETHFTLTDDDGTRTQGGVSMNHIFSHQGYRLYQSSYDEDGRGSILSINSDPVGIPITYAGYALLLVSLLWMLFDPKGDYRRLLRHPLLKKGVLAFALLLSPSLPAQAQQALPRETAAKFGQLFILHNDRICPMQTFAQDFTMKLHGAKSYKGFTAEQVLTGFIFHGDEWSGEPLIKMKAGPLKETLQLPDYCSVNTFFNPTMGGYILGPYVEEYYQGQHDKFHSQVADMDERLQLVMELRHGHLLKVFPCEVDGDTKWYGPTDQYGANVDSMQQLFMRNYFSLVYESVLECDYANMESLTAKLQQFQQAHGGSSLPSATQVKAERTYNAIPFATILFVANLTLGFLTLLVAMRHIVKPIHVRTNKRVAAASRLLMSLSLAALTACLALRWEVSGKVPMANGYETMLFVAWMVMVAALVASRWSRLVLSFGFLMSGFFLLVSHIGQMDPAITRTMPVLNSPLLSVHVSLIMSAFALLSLTFVCGVVALALPALSRKAGVEAMDSLALLSKLFLYPALALLAVGIFVGAVWANVSWGSYWGWDPKEVWALITLMAYAVAAHTRSIPALAHSRTYHIYMICAFLTVLMTYFGVNYYLGGMHSYA